MRIMGIDSDGAFGWALYDTHKPPSAIESGSLNLDPKDDIVNKLIELRVRFVPIVKELQPTFAGVEKPAEYLPKYPVKEGAGPDDLMSPLERSKAQAEGKVQWKEQSTKGITVTNQIAGAATVLFLCWNVRCIQVAPKSWQTIIPKSFKAQVGGPGAPKKWAKSYCDSLKIQSPNQSSRDACLIALWTAGHAQELKMIERARQTA
jgi:hypothetical protein